MLRTAGSTNGVCEEASTVRVLLQLRGTLLFLANIVWIDGNIAAICSGVVDCLDRVAALAATTSTISGKLTRTLDKDPGEFWWRIPGLRSRWPLRAVGAEAVAPPARPTFRHSESAHLLLTSEEEAESTFETVKGSRWPREGHRPWCTFRSDLSPSSVVPSVRYWTLLGRCFHSTGRSEAFRYVSRWTGAGAKTHKILPFPLVPTPPSLPTSSGEIRNVRDTA